MGNSAVRIASMTAVRQDGELARIRVLAGPDAGSVFAIKNMRATIGRGQENDLVISDIKASRKHAELLVSGDNVTIQDSGSTHGILVNGQNTRFANLKSGDQITIGSTTFEYVSAAHGHTQMLTRPPLKIVSGVSGIGVRSGSVGAPQSFIERNKKFIIALGVLVVIAALLPEVEQKQKAKKKEYLEPKDLDFQTVISEMRSSEVISKARKDAEKHFAEGYREYRAGNYLRAQIAFETALQIYGDHELARMYLETTKKAVEDEAQSRFKLARRDEGASRFRSALGHYEAVRRLYSRDQSNKNYKEAEVRIEELQKKIKEGERF